MKEAGISNCELLEHPADGESVFLDKTMPLAWDVTKGKLNLQVHQRSCDVPLGLPFNVTQYSTLLKMIAQVTELEPGIISYSIQDAHIYVNQLDGIKEQLRREERYNELVNYSANSLYVLK